MERIHILTDFLIKLVLENLNVFSLAEIIKKGNTSWPFSASVSSCRSEFGGSEESDHKWLKSSFVCHYVHYVVPCPIFFFLSFTPPSAWLRARPQTLTLKETGPPHPPPPPPVPHSVSLCFTNWLHSESTGRKTKRDIPPFFPTSPWPHTRSAHMCYNVRHSLFPC